MTKRFLIIGGPGFGKTSLVDELKKLNYGCFYDDKSRELIKELFKINPEIDVSGYEFNKAVMDVRVEQFQAACGTCFFDRGIPDGIAYLKKVPEEFWNIASKYKYEKQVFVCPAWEEIFQTEKAKGRAENSFEDAVNIHKKICDVYLSLGYELIELPKTTVKDRVNFILEKINP